MRTWIYLQNPFETATENNYLLMLNISQYHLNKLEQHIADPGIAPMRDAYLALANDYNNKYVAWKAAGGTQVSKTLTLTQLLEQSGAKLNLWEPQIMVIYPKTSPQYSALFPQGRKPFNQGAITTRIAAFAALADALAAYPPLAAIKTAADTYSLQLTDARTQQQQNMNNSTEVEASRIAACTQMYKNLGTFISLYPTDPAYTTLFFDLDAIRNHEQLIYTGTLQANEIHQILKHKFDEATDHLFVINNSEAPMEIYFNNGLDNGPQGGIYHMPPHLGNHITPTDAGYADNKRHLWIKNLSSVDGCQWEVDLE